MALQFIVPSMACSACATAITQAIQAIDPNAEVSADPKTKLVVVETQASEAAIKTAIAEAGYTVT